jgi:hypothetical protein
MGGYMGLFLGCSVLSIVEIFDHFMLCCCFKKKKKRKTLDTEHTNGGDQPHVDATTF